jgi:hypothetical protein
MKTYTFAPAGAPVQEHMAGLVKALVGWMIREQNLEDRANSAKAKNYHRGRVQLYREIIDTIEDSNSI